MIGYRPQRDKRSANLEIYLRNNLRSQVVTALRSNKFDAGLLNV